MYYARCTQLASHKLCIGSVMNRLKRDLGTGDLCDNIGLVGVSTKRSYVTASPSHHYKAIPILSPLHVDHSYIPLFKMRIIFDLLVSPPFLVLFRQVATRVYMSNYYRKPAHLSLLHPCPHCSSTVRFVSKKTNMASFIRVHTFIATY